MSAGGDAMSQSIPHNRKVATVTEPQSWVLIGLFASIMLGVLGLVTTSLNRTMRSGFDRLEVKFDTKIDSLEKVMDVRFAQVESRFEQVDARFAQVDARFAQVDARFESVERKLGDLDADVTAITRRLLD